MVVWGGQKFSVMQSQLKLYNIFVKTFEVPVVLSEDARVGVSFDVPEYISTKYIHIYCQVKLTIFIESSLSTNLLAAASTLIQLRDPEKLIIILAVDSQNF